MLDAPIPDEQFERLLRRALGTVLDTEDAAEFLKSGDTAKIQADGFCDQEDFAYFIGDLSKSFSLREPDTERVYVAWSWNPFAKPKYQLFDFTVGELREMARLQRWSSSVLRSIGRPPAIS